jgi:DNA polymerase-3 subunit epsilon
MGIESHDVYNARAEAAIAAFKGERETVAILGRGRHKHERSLVLVEKGDYVGYGFLDRNVAISDFQSAKNYVTKSVETRTVKNLISSYIDNPRGAEVVVF